MAKQNKPTPQQLKAVKNLIKAGVKRVESDNRYHLVNNTIQSNGTPTLALGGYQFVPFHHWNKIVEWGKKNPKYKKDFEWLKPISKSSHHNFKTDSAKSNYQKFLKNKQMQDDFMDHYIDEIMPQAQRLYNEYGKRYNLRLDEVFAILHHQGTGGGETAITSGKINYKSPDGTGGDKYLKKFNQGVYEYAGVKKDAKGNFVGTKAQRNLFVNDYAVNGQNRKYKDPTGYKIDETSSNKAFTEYIKAYNSNYKKLVAPGGDAEQKQAEFNKNMSTLYDKYKKNGQIDQINSHIANYNNKKYQENYATAKDLEVKRGIFNRINFILDNDKNIKNHLISTADLTTAQIDYIKKNDKLFKLQANKSNGKSYYTINDLKAFSDDISAGYKKTMDVSFKPTHSKDGKLFLNPIFKIDSSKTGFRTLDRSTILTAVDPAKIKKEYIHAPTLSKTENNFGDGNIPTEFDNIVPEDISDTDSGYTDIGDIGGGDSSFTPPAGITPETEEFYKKFLENQEAQLEQDKIQQEEARQRYEEEQKQQKEDGLDSDVSETMDFLGKTADSIKTDTTKYDVNDYKSDLPVSSLANSLAGIVIGNEMEKTDLPDYDPEVNLAYQSYIAEMAEISRRGLSPEDEAAAKSHIQDAYSAGIQQITKASGGNRNVLLGNLGRLDAQKNKSLIDLSVEDAKMKMEGLKSYGEGMKYINDFDQNVYLQNYNRDLQVAQERRRNGGDLTTAAWTSLNNEMNHYENNKPGSVNHMMKVKYLESAYNYNPLLKDDKSGTVEGTWSRIEKQNEEKNKNKAALEQVQKIMSSLGRQEQWALNSFIKKNNYNPEESIALGQYLQNNQGSIDLDELTKDPITFYNQRVKGIVNEQKQNGVAPPIEVGVVSAGQETPGVAPEQAITPAVNPEVAKWNVNPVSDKPTEIQPGFNDINFNQPNQNPQTNNTETKPNFVNAFWPGLIQGAEELLNKNKP